MPLIPIPTNEPEVDTRYEGPSNEWLADYINVKPWVCTCGLTNFGRNQKCAKCRLEKK